MLKSYKMTLAKTQVQSPFFRKGFIQAATRAETVHQSNQWNKAPVLQTEARILWDRQYAE